MNKIKILNGNVLKIIAAISMLIDHIGFIMFPDIDILRIFGRLAFPIFAFMIAEGCKYTRNKVRYFLTISIFAVVWAIVNKFISDTKMNILITFTLAIIMIYALSFFKKSLTTKDTPFSKQIIASLIFVLSIAGVYVFTIFINVDYGFWGCMLPLFVSTFHQGKDEENLLKKIDTPLVSTIMLFIGLIILSAIYGWNYQWFSLISVLIMLFYSGERGKLKMKYFFYVFYPLHIIILYSLNYLIF